MWMKAETLDDGYAHRDLRGICAICREPHLVRFCPRCRAVVCEGCRWSVFHRGLEAVKSLLGKGYHGEVWV